MDEDQQKLFLLTLIMDFSFIYILSVYKLSTFDYSFCYWVLITHLLFLYGLWKDNQPLLEYLHYLLFLMLSISIFIQHKGILLISLFLLSIIQILWITEERCILIKKGQVNEFGYGKELNIYVFLLTIGISLRVGKRL